MLARTIRIVGESGLDPVIVVLGAHHSSIMAALDLRQVHTVLNSDWEQGIASSIHSGIQELLRIDPKSKDLALLVCDQPKLSVEHLKALIEIHQQTEDVTIIASRYADVTGIPAIFPASEFANLQSLRGDSGARSLLRNPMSPVVSVLLTGGEIDIDSPSDLSESLVNSKSRRELVQGHGSNCRIFNIILAPLVDHGCTAIDSDIEQYRLSNEADQR